MKADVFRLDLICIFMLMTYNGMSHVKNILTFTFQLPSRKSSFIFFNSNI
jgi:hypothetical protein